MLKRLGSLVLFASLVGAVPAEAQTVRFGVGIVPVIGLEDGAGSDFGIGAQLDYVPAGNWGVRVDGAYMFDEYLLWNGDVAYHFTTASSRIHPFLLGGLAVVNDDSFDNAELGVGLGGGLNIHIPNSPVGVYVDARFQRFFDADFNQIQLGGGIRFGQGE